MKEYDKFSYWKLAKTTFFNLVLHIINNMAEQVIRCINPKTNKVRFFKKHIVTDSWSKSTGFIPQEVEDNSARGTSYEQKAVEKENNTNSFQDEIHKAAQIITEEINQKEVVKQRGRPRKQTENAN